MKIVAEDKLVEGKTQDLLAEWERDKPVEVQTKTKLNTKIPSNSTVAYCILSILLVVCYTGQLETGRRDKRAQDV